MRPTIAAAMTASAVNNQTTSPMVPTGLTMSSADTATNVRPSTALRAQLRARLVRRIKDLELTQRGAGAKMKLATAQMSKLMRGDDIFTIDRLVDAAARLGLKVRITVTRPYEGG